jgi:hypothetical protein
VIEKILVEWLDEHGIWRMSEKLVLAQRLVGGADASVCLSVKHTLRAAAGRAAAYYRQHEDQTAHSKGEHDPSPPPVKRVHDTNFLRW